MPPAPFPRRALIEELEPRLLFSADFALALADAPVAQTELRVIGANGEFAGAPDSQQQARHARLEVVFLDLRVQDYEKILADIHAQNTGGRSIEVVLLDSERDGVAQIGEFLGQRHDIDAVHIISHGSAGAVQLGAGQLNFDSLLSNAAAIKQWGNALSADADILIYGCDLAGSEAGKSLVDALGRLSGADVAASDDKTGAADLGGDWEMEYRTGAIETRLAVSAGLSQSWSHVLAIGVDAVSSGVTATTSITLSHTTSGADRLMLVGVSMHTDNVAVNSMTYNGAVLSRLGFQEDAGGKTRIEIWALIAPTAGTFNLNVSFADARAAIVGAMTFTGVDQTTPYGSFASAQGLSTNASLTGFVSAANEIVFGVVNQDKGTALTPGAGQTEYWDIVGDEANGGGTLKAGAASVNLSWTLSPSDQSWAAGAVSIKPVTNRPPVNTIPGAQTTAEETARVFSSANGNPISIADADAGGANNQVTLGVANGTLTLSGATGLSFSAGANGTATMTVRGAASAINAALDGLSYSPAANYNGSDTLTMSTKDSLLFSLDIDASLLGRYAFDSTGALGADTSPAAGNAGTPVNAAANSDATRGNVLSLDGTGFIQTAGRFGNPPNATLAAWVNLAGADTQGAEVISLGDSLALRLDHTGGVGLRGFFYNGSTWEAVDLNQNLAGTGWRHVAFTFDDTGNKATLYLDGAAVNSLTTTASIAYTLGADSFVGKHGNGDTRYDFNGKIDDARVYNRVLTASEIAALAADLPLTATSAIAINVSAVNDAPVLATGSTLSYTENQVATAINTAITVSDVDNATLASATVAITGGYVSAEDVLAFANSGMGNIAGVWNSGTGVMTLASAGATATTAQWQAALRAVTYANTSDNPGTAARTVSYTVNDGALASNTVISTVNVSAVNDAPVNIVPASIAVTEDVASALTGISIADVDAAGSSLFVTLSVPAGALAATSGGGVLVGGSASALTLSGTVATLNSFLAAGNVTYATAANANGAVTLTVLTSDQGSSGAGGTLTDSDTVTLNITPVNDAPVANNDSGSGNEDTPITGNVLTNDTDADNDTLSARLVSGPANGTLTLNADGSFTYTPNANWNGTDSFQYLVNDGSGLVHFWGLEGNGTDSAGGANGTLMNGPTPVAGRNGNALQFDGVDDYVALPDLSYSNAFSLAFYFKVADNSGTGLQYFYSHGSLPNAGLPNTIQVALVENAYAIPGQRNRIVTTVWDSNDPASGQIFTDIGTLIGDGQWHQYAMTVTVGEGTRVYVDGALKGSFASGGDAINPAGNAYFGARSDLDPTRFLNAGGGMDGVSLYNRALAASEVASLAANPQQATASLTVNPVNDAPTTSPVTLTAITEDSGARLITQAELLANANDIDGPGLTASGLVVSAGAGALTDNGDGTWTYTPSLNDDTSVSFSYTVSDGSLSAAGSATLDITPVNDAPTVANAIPDQTAAEDAAFSFQFAAGTFDAVDAGDTLTYSATGVPSWLAFDPATRSFAGTPANADVGVFTVTVRAADGSGAFVEDLFVLTVVNTNDAPTVAAINLGAINEDGSRVITQAELLAGANDVDGDPLAALNLTLTSGSGVLTDNGDGSWTFAPAADWNGAASFGFDVSDGMATTANTASLIVNAVNDAPVIASNMLSITEGGAVVLSNANLNANDVEQGPAQLTYTVSNMMHGQFEWAAMPGAAISSFTQADVDAGSVVFVHDASDFAPSYDMRVSDGTTAAGPQAATILFTPVNEGINVSALSGTATTEAGGTVTFNVALNSQPFADVTVFIASGNPAEGTASVSSLTFTTSNWNSVQQVTVTGVNDFVADGDRNYAVQLHATSTDRNYQGLAAPDVALVNLDDDTAGIVMTPSAGLVTGESGASDTFSVVLTSQPFADVTIGLSSSNPGEGTLSSSSLVFTAANWNIPQVVTVTGVGDAVNDGDRAYQVIAAPAASMDPGYNGLAAGGVDITNLDMAEPVAADPPPVAIVSEPVPQPADEAGAPEAPAEKTAENKPAAESDVNGRVPLESVASGEIPQTRPVEGALNSGLKTSAPMPVNNESARREVLTNPEIQGGVLLRLLEIIRAEHVMGDTGNNSISPAVQVEISQDETFRVEILSQGAQITAVSLSVGAVWWALRAGGLFASLLTSLPAWRSFDVLPVLSREEDEDDSSWGLGDAPADGDKNDDPRPLELTP